MKIYLFAFAFMAYFVSYAQQDPQYSQYMFNMVNVNPGYAGSRNVLSLVALHRNQWMNVDGAPKTSSFTADMPICNNKWGIGLSFVNDKIGRFNSNTFNVFAAYRLKTDSKGTLGMGLTAGANMLRAQLSDIRSNPQGLSETLFQDFTKTSPVLGVGFFYNRDRWYLGISAPSLLSNNESKYTKNNSVLRKFHHFFLMGGYVLKMSEEVKLKPSFMLKGVAGGPMAVDLNLNVWLHDIVSLGASYRVQNALVAMIEVQATKELRFGYAMDYPTTDFKNSKGSTPLTHEFLLRYEFGIQKKKIIAPRYF